MITESISTNILVSTIMFFFVIVLFRNVLLNKKLKKHEIIILPLLFLIWFGGTKILLNFYFSEDIIGLITDTSISFIFLTILFVEGIIRNKATAINPKLTKISFIL